MSTASTIYTGSGERCDLGVITPEAEADGMRRLNLYRWLVGLDPATTDAAHQQMAQQAALMMDVNNSLSHSPPTTWECYTAEGASAAGSSNLALGYSTPAATIDAYMGDRGTPSLGHRRWCIHPPLGGVGVGHHGSGGALWVFGCGRGMLAPAYVAYPSAGPFPTQALFGDWSFASDQIGGDVTVLVFDTTAGANVETTASMRAGGYGLNTLGFLPATTEVGHTYRITIDSPGTVGRGFPTPDATDPITYVYETTLMSCP